MDRETPKKSPLTPKEARLIYELYQHAFYNNVNGARSQMEGLSPELRQKLIRQHHEITLDPSVIVAINNKSVDMVKYLIDDCKADIDELYWLKIGKGPLYAGRVYPSYQSVFTGEPVCCATPLDYAVSNNAVEIVKFLVSRGADTTRLRQEGNRFLISPFTTFEITRLLLERGADVNSTTSDGFTPLMRAAAKDVRTCQFLIERGAEMNSVSSCGETALHAAVKADDPQTVRLLLENGADPFTQDGDGHDPFRIACFNNYEETLNVLCSKVLAHADEVHREQIDRYLRVSSLRKLRRTFAQDPDLAFGMFDRPDSDQAAKLEAVRCDLQEGLDLTREILGPDHPWFLDAMLETALCYLETGFYDLWLRQLIHNFKALRCPNLDIKKRYEEFGRISDQIRRGISDLSCIASPDGADICLSLGFDAAYEIVKTVATEAANCSPDEVDKLQDCISLLFDLIHFVDCDDNQKQSLWSLVRRIVKLGLRSNTGETLLMLSTDKCDSFSATPLNVVTMLLECGADVNERDVQGNNVVHRLFPRLTDYADIAEQLARIFLEHGVHLDARNHEGMTTYWCLNQDHGIEVYPPINLMCLAARVVRRYNIPCDGEIPKSLIDFIEMH